MHPTRRSAPASAALSAALLVVGLLCAREAPATIVGGRLGTGRANAPALRVYAWSRTAGRLYSLAGGTATTWDLDLPPGRYWLFAGLDGPGAPPIYAAYTEFLRCQRHGVRVTHGDCDAHDLAEVEVAGERLSHVDLTDWALSDASATTLDTLLGRSATDPYDASARAAPKFTEYPARSGATAAPPREPSGYREADREAVLEAWAEAPSFAARLTFIPVSCGGGCAGIALLDHGTGVVRYPATLNPLPDAPPCETHAVLQYRRDSRLLIVRSAAAKGPGPGAQMHYYVVDVDSGELRSIASRPATDVPAHCAGGERAGR